MQRCLGPATALTSGQWTDRTASGNPALACPDCGQIDEVKPHEIDKLSGRLRYRWACPAQCCGCIEFLVLEAFNEEVLV